MLFFDNFLKNLKIKRPASEISIWCYQNEEALNHNSSTQNKHLTRNSFLGDVKSNRQQRNQSLASLVEEIDLNRAKGLSSALRLFVLEELKKESLTEKDSYEKKS